LLQSADYVGSTPLVVFFYPKDDTLGCTIESCAFRDSHKDFAAAGAVVIGISADSIASHRAFQEKFGLPFLLASDPDRAVARAFGVPDGRFGLAGRATFVIDKRGVVRDAFLSRLRPKKHVSRALEAVRRLAGEPA
jgi:peroxiredoxin Q/BCP